MSKENKDGMIRVHLWMDQGDIEEIDRLYGQSLGRSKAIRLFTKKYLGIIKAKVAEQANTPEIGAHDLTA